MKKRFVDVAAVALAALPALLTACTASAPITGPLQAGSASSGLSLTSAGVYKGALASHRAATLLMLYDGTAYLFYGPDAPGNAALGGVVVVFAGQQSSDGQFKSIQATNFTFRPPGGARVSMSVDFSHAPNVAGAVVASGDAAASPLNFAAVADQMLGQTPSLAAAAGLYSGQAGSTKGRTSAQVTVTADGLLAGTMPGGCVFQGKIAPHAGLDAYDVSLTFGGAPCPEPGVSVAGNAVLDAGRLLAALPATDRSDVFYFVGGK
jgi:hypothetical protein